MSKHKFTDDRSQMAHDIKTEMARQGQSRRQCAGCGDAFYAAFENEQFCASCHRGRRNA